MWSGGTIRPATEQDNVKNDNDKSMVEDSNMKKVLAGVLVAGACVGFAYGNDESKTTTSSGITSTLLFGPAMSGQSLLISLDTKTQLAASDVVPVVNIYVRQPGNEKSLVTTATAIGTHAACLNTASNINVGTNVFVIHKSGNIERLTASSVTHTSVTFSGSSTYAFAVDDELQPEQAAAAFTLNPSEVDVYGAVTNITYKNAGDAIFATPNHSAMRIALTGTNSTLSATVRK